MQTRDDATGSTSPRPMSALSLASGLESRGGADRSSIGRLLSLPRNPLSRGAAPEVGVARPGALEVKLGCQCVSEGYLSTS